MYLARLDDWTRLVREMLHRSGVHTRLILCLTFTSDVRNIMDGLYAPMSLSSSLANSLETTQRHATLTAYPSLWNTNQEPWTDVQRSVYPETNMGVPLCKRMPFLKTTSNQQDAG